MRALQTPVALDPVDARLIDHLQGDLPLSERPFAEVGAALGLSEDDVLARLQRLLAQGVLTRFGPLFQIERAGGQFLLAAVEVPVANFERVAALINALPEVAHNYQREHRLNMWFVVACSTPAEVEQACLRIEAATGLAVHRFPKLREYFVGLRLSAQRASAAQGAALNVGLDVGLPPALAAVSTEAPHGAV